MGRNILKQQEESKSNKQTEKRLYSVSKSPSVFLKTDRKSKSVPWGFFLGKADNVRPFSKQTKSHLQLADRRLLARCSVTFTDRQDGGAELHCRNAKGPGSGYESH